MNCPGAGTSWASPGASGCGSRRVSHPLGSGGVPGSGVATVGVAAVTIGAVAVTTAVGGVAVTVGAVGVAVHRDDEGSPGSHSVLMSSLVMLMAPTIPRRARRTPTSA